ncbi:PR domain zinc finger protein 5-like isoform X6 [Portunus trituberculatus]|uniref:PR domain zinc finger protein 5-like isoform X6 n=1 Tax=Portunus trituberculatus TaxID=210409 RepID=UPI001E1CF539|nr:PR domain zinc finger protein 5-like isoform X6 [Portunus trituberculatus]
MASEEKILQVGEAQETPQAITITIVDPSALGSTSLDPSLVAQGGADQGSIVMVSGAEDSKAILQTVTETHMGTEELPIISNISNPEEEEMIVHETKLSESFDGGGEEGELGDSYEDVEEPSGPHCLVCNIDLTTNDSDEQVPVFKTQTSTTQRKVAVFLSSLIGQKVTSRKAHSDILCRRCFSLLDRVDSLEVEIRETKEEIINKYQETVSVYGGRARRIKPATAKKPDYVFPKVEPEDEADQLLDMELDGNFEPQVEDLMDEDPSLQDDDWEPKFKRPRIKKESTSIGVCESSDPPKRKRGRPRKDLTKAKEEAPHLESIVEGRNVGGVEDDHFVRGVGKRPIKLECLPQECQASRPKQPKPAADSVTHVYLDELLACPDCGELFNSEPLFKVHCSEAHAMPSRKCPHCPRVFDKKYDLDSHLVNHIPNNLSCDKCEVGFPTAAFLIKHLKDNHPDTANTCTSCNATFINEKQLQFHFEKKHKRGKRKVANTDMKVAHVNSIICEECGNVCKNMIAYHTHRYKEHIHLFPHECKVCCRRFSKLKFLESHLKTHINGSYECLKCTVKFGTEYHLVDHMYYVHGQKKVLMCEECKRFFSSPTSLKTHKEMEHKDNMECPETCVICKEKYPSKLGLKRHMLSHIRAYQCKFCHRKLSSKASLDIHINMVHTKEHAFSCSQCEREFYAKHLLQMHIKRVHSDRSDFQFKCKLCGKVYLQEWELTLHHKTHTNERNYKCDVCGDAFYTLSRMRYHRATHKTTRDSECPICSQMFRRDVDTKNHLRRVHKVAHPGNFMDLCSRHGLEKAKELTQVETASEHKVLTGKVEDVMDEDGLEHITLYRVEEEQKPPVQVVIPDGMGMMVLEDTAMDAASTANAQQPQDEVAYIYEVRDGKRKQHGEVIDFIKVKEYTW